MPESLNPARAVRRVLLALFLLLVPLLLPPLLPAQVPVVIPSGTAGVGVGAANVTANSVGAVTSLAITITSLNLTAIDTGLIQCWSGTGPYSPVTITSFTTTGSSPITTVTPSFTSTANVTCRVNSNGGAGAAGATGATGAAGATGATGATGAAGTNGTNGTNGSTGATGATGPTGATGAAGSNGTNGTNGTNGAISQIQDEGSNLTVRANVNFKGSGVTCADNSGTTTTDCTIPGGAAQGIFGSSVSTAPSFSATPTFSLADVSAQSPVRFEPGALTANVTSVTFSNKTAGAKFSIVWTQDGTGGRTVSYGASATNACDVTPTASIATTQLFEVGADGTTVNGVGCRDTSSDAVRGPEESAAGTPLASKGVCWFDSTDHSGLECKSNNSANTFKMVLTGIDINPVTGQVTASHFSSALPVSQGGWGVATLTAHALYVGNGTAAPTALSVCGSTTVVHGITGADPTCAQVAIGSDVSGLGANVGAFLAAPSGANFNSMIAAGGIPLVPVSHSANYTHVLADCGGAWIHPTADNNARTFTIDSNANVACAVGSTITIYNQINTLTITITSDTLVLGGTLTTGNRSVAAGGLVTLWKVGTTTWTASGPGVT